MSRSSLERWLYAPWALAPVVFAASAPPVQAWASAELVTRERALALAFPGATSFEERTGILTQAQLERLAPRLRGERSSRLVCATAARGPAGPDGSPGELLGFAVVDDVLGKSLPITYLAAFGPDARVLAVEILFYRESHGGEVAERAFRSQFAGFTPDDAIDVGRDVRNVAGATISCRAITDGVHDLCLLVRELFAAAPVLAAPARPAPGARVLDAADRSPAVALVRTRVLMNSPLRLELHGERGADASQAAFDEVARLERLWSAFLPGSDLARLAEAAGGQAVSIAPETAQLFEQLARWSAITRGAFDPLVGPVSLASKRATPESGSAGTAHALGAAPGALSATLEVDAPGARARLTLPGARLDLGAVAKGAALDRAIALLAGAAVPRALLDFGGQVAALVPAGQPGFAIGVRDPRTADGPPLASLELRSGSLAVSSDAERGSDERSHLVDPRTGAGASTDLACAAVHAARGAEADALSAGLYVLGWEEARAVALEHDLAVLLLRRDGALWSSPAFELLAHVAPSPTGVAPARASSGTR